MLVTQDRETLGSFFEAFHSRPQSSSLLSMTDGSLSRKRTIWGRKCEAFVLLGIGKLWKPQTKKKKKKNT